MANTNQTLTVAGDSTIYHTGVYNGTPSDYTGMNLDDNDTSYILEGTINSNSYNSLWKMSSFTGVDKINSLTLYAKINGITYDGYYRWACAPQGSPYTSYYLDAGYNSTGTGSYVLRSLVSTVNPITGLAWTKSDVNSLDFGVWDLGGIGNYDGTRVSYFYIVVNYAATTDYTPDPLTPKLGMRHKYPVLYKNGIQVPNPSGSSSAKDGLHVSEGRKAAFKRNSYLRQMG